MTKPKGSAFENSVLEFFKKIFEEMGFIVIEARKQWSGTQNGFDVRITFLDDDNNERCLFFECKDYESTLNWENILEKILELEAANYSVDGFIALSPKVEISNIKDNVHAKLIEKFKFPIKLWTPNSHIEEIFSLDADIFKNIYKKECTNHVDRDFSLNKLKAIINCILKEKHMLKLVNRIEIKSATRTPNEDSKLVTTLDLKLNEVFDIDDPDRIKFHQLRCDYKVYLEELTDINNSLRAKIFKWQENLRLKAERLTRKFKNYSDYSPTRFFHEFFDEADKELLTFFQNERLDGDKEKLLNGVIFEIAAECSLDWRKINNGTVN